MRFPKYIFQTAALCLLILSAAATGFGQKTRAANSSDFKPLAGANNLGHKTGWCHTGGMRDPSQTTD